MEYPARRQPGQRRQRFLRQQTVRVVLDDHRLVPGGDLQDVGPSLQRHGRGGRILDVGGAVDQPGAALAQHPVQPVGAHALCVHRHPGQHQPELGRERADAGIGELLGDQRVAGLQHRAHHRHQRALRARREQHLVHRSPAEQRMQPLDAGLAFLQRADGQAVRHQHADILLAQQTVHPVGEHALQRRFGRHRRQVHRQVDHRLAIVAPARCAGAGAHEAAAAHRGVQQAATLGLGEGAGDGGQVDAEPGGQRPLRRQSGALAQLAGADRVFQHLDDRQIERPVMVSQPLPPETDDRRVLRVLQPPCSRRRRRFSPRARQYLQELRQTFHTRSVRVRPGKV